MGKTKKKENSKRSLHVVAIFEATKGLLVLVVELGLLTFLLKDFHLAGVLLFILCSGEEASELIALGNNGR